MLKILSICLLLITIANADSAFATKLYKWVDKDGNISYQDTPPPEGSQVIKEEEITSPSPTNAEPTSTDADQTSESTIVFRQQPVVVYTVPNCPACELLLEKLQGWDIPASQQSLQNRDVQARILASSDSLSAPTLFIGESLIADHSDQSLSAELQKAGYQINITDEEEIPEETDVQAGS